MWFEFRWLDKMVAAKIGFAEGTCPKCEKKLRRRRPADSAICDCYLYCPLCGAKMTPYTPDLTPTAYEAEKGLDSLYVCTNHAPPYYSSQKPVEVRLR
jgi:predicted amidophosphoribosyltransferase